MLHLENTAYSTIKKTITEPPWVWEETCTGQWITGIAYTYHITFITGGDNGAEYDVYAEEEITSSETSHTFNVPVKAGDTMDYWTLNGERVTGNTITLTVPESQQDQNCTIEATVYAHYTTYKYLLRFKDPQLNYINGYAYWIEATTTENPVTFTLPSLEPFNDYPTIVCWVLMPEFSMDHVPHYPGEQFEFHHPGGSERYELCMFASSIDSDYWGEPEPGTG